MCFIGPSGRQLLLNSCSGRTAKQGRVASHKPTPLTERETVMGMFQHLSQSQDAQFPECQTFTFKSLSSKQCLQLHSSHHHHCTFITSSCPPLWDLNDLIKDKSSKTSDNISLLYSKLHTLTTFFKGIQRKETAQRQLERLWSDQLLTSPKVNIRSESELTASFGD